MDIRDIPDIAGITIVDVGNRSLERGQYLYHASGCVNCHTAKKGGKPLAGGRKLGTPFGDFISPNITPDKEFGIGLWNDEDFIRALRFGVSPRGEHYFPVFPYTSYSAMNYGDMLDLKAYLVNALGHCGECHTPRNFMGAVDKTRALSGTKNGPEGGRIPNLTPDPETGLGKWLKGDIETVLEMGMLPDGDFVGSIMTEVVDNTTSHLSADDRQAIEIYLRSRPPLKSDWRSK